MKKYLLLGMLAVLFAIPLWAAEKAIIKLPDGIYLFDSSMTMLTNGNLWIGFGKFIVVKNNNIYSSKEAIKKFGSSRINKQLTDNKKYKIILGEKKIGELNNLKIFNDGDGKFDEELFTEKIRQGPIYGEASIYLGRLGSAARCLAVPEKYKEVQKVYQTISKIEVNNISKLCKTQLYNQFKELKEIGCKLIGLDKERIDLLDKISDHNDELYVGVYRYVFKTESDGYCEYEVTFSVNKNKVHYITNDYNGETKMCGMLDVDEDGEGELIIRRISNDEEGGTEAIEIYKQKDNGNWTLIYKNL